MQKYNSLTQGRSVALSLLNWTYTLEYEAKEIAIFFLNLQTHLEMVAYLYLRLFP